MASTSATLDAYFDFITPKNINNFLGNEDLKESLQCFLTSMTSPSYLIIGPSGAGKTTICNLVLKLFGDTYCVFRPVYEDYHNHKDFAAAINKFITTKNMLEIFQQRKKLLFLDDIDVILTTDRYANTYIQEVLKTAKEVGSIKILMTCSRGNEKRVTDIKKKTLHGQLINPPVPLLMTLVEMLLSSFKLVPKIDNILRKSLYLFIQKCAFNIRLIILNLDSFLAELVAVSPIQEHDEDCAHVIFDKNITDIVSSICQAPEWDMRTLDIWLSIDPCLVSYIAYDNTLSPYVSSRIEKRKKTSCLIPQLVQTFADSSLMETFVYAKNDSFLNDICNIWRCGVLKETLRGCEDIFEHHTMKYTTIPTRSSNFYNAMKKDATTSSKTLLGRDEILFCASLNIIKDDATLKTFNRKSTASKKKSQLKE